MTRDEMLTAVIRKWGFEHRFTIRFAKACEDFTCEEALTALFRWTMGLSVEVFG